MKNKHEHKHTAHSHEKHNTAPQEPAPDAETVAEAAQAEAADNQEPQPTKDANELAALKDKYLRLLADFDNARKRQLREREEWIKSANEGLIKDMLPVIDHLELAVSKAPEGDDPFVGGVKLVLKQFLEALAKQGATPVDAVNAEFDPNLHEALSVAPSATVAANTVLEQYRCGWLLNGKLIRAAQVIVSGGAPESAE